MKIKQLILLSSALAVSGCVAKYTPPTTGDMATVEFNIDAKSHGYSHSVGAFENSMDDKTCESEKEIGSKNWTEEDNFDFGPVKVEADKPFGYKLHYGFNPAFASVALCFSKGAFTPEANKNYVIHHFVDNQKYQCETKVYVRNDDELAEITPVVPKLACTRNNSQFFTGSVNVRVTN